MKACENGHEQIARALLEAGADRNMAVSGWTALMFANNNGLTAICKLLDIPRAQSTTDLRRLMIPAPRAQPTRICAVS